MRQHLNAVKQKDLQPTAGRFWGQRIGERRNHRGYAIAGDLSLADARRLWQGRPLEGMSHIII
jgi:hypothetical protein